MTPLEERVEQLRAAQRRQRQRWADEGRCEDCGTDFDVTTAAGYSTVPVSLCAACRIKRSGAHG